MVKTPVLAVLSAIGLKTGVLTVPSAIGLNGWMDDLILRPFQHFSHIRMMGG